MSAYNVPVARGWESKSIEEQQASALSDSSPHKPHFTPAQLEMQRKKQDILLSRQRTLQQLQAAQNPRHREMLQGALADLDAQLLHLG
jgi:hypothetical protein